MKYLKKIIFIISFVIPTLSVVMHATNSEIDFFLDDEISLPAPILTEPSLLKIYIQKIGIKIMLKAYACKDQCVSLSSSACMQLKNHIFKTFSYIKERIKPIATATASQARNTVGVNAQNCTP